MEFCYCGLNGLRQCTLTEGLGAYKIIERAGGVAPSCVFRNNSQNNTPELAHQENCHLCPKQELGNQETAQWQRSRVTQRSKGPMISHYHRGFRDQCQRTKKSPQEPHPQTTYPAFCLGCPLKLLQKNSFNLLTGSSRGAEARFPLSPLPASRPTSPSDWLAGRPAISSWALVWWNPETWLLASNLWV